MANQEFDWSQCLQYASLSDVGIRRTNNQDSHAEVLASDVATWYERGHLFVVADGMGAHAAGELASKMAVDTIPLAYHKNHDLSPPEAIQGAIRQANTEINERGEANVEFHRMGTTCSVAVLLPQGALIGHVGDSRVYRFRGSRLQQLTFDHSLVWEMQAAGQIKSRDEGSLAIPKNVITRSLGPHPTVQVDLEGPFAGEVGDTFLLCSDGLTARVEDEEIAIVLSHLEPREATSFLVDLANVRGGPDNITVTIFKITGPEITTRASGAEPLTVGGDQHIEHSVHVAVWLVMGVCVLASIVLALAEKTIPALAGAVLSVIAVGVAMAQKFGLFEKSGVSLSGKRRLGRGPHRQVDVPSADGFLGQVIQNIDEWRETATSNGWDTDWTNCVQFLSKAKQHWDSKDVSGALRNSGQALSLTAQEIKSRQPRWPYNSTSSI